MPRIGCCDQALAHHIQAEADKLPMPGIYELRASGSGGHVTLGGRVDSPDTLKQIVRSIANTPGLTQLSFLGVEFEPPDVPDDVIVAHARNAADQAIGNDLASKLGYYCEDHRLFVYGTLPSLPLREKLEEAIRQVHGVGLYHVTCEVVLTDPPSDARVVAAVKRKFRRPLDLANITFRASQVEVTSVQNVVYLTGKANTLLGKLSAGAQAAQVEGVRYVVNRIEVPGVPSMDVPRTQPPLNEQPSPAEPAAAKVLYEPASDTGELSEALRIATPPQ
jgi:osmotically-inducible protein OsmY